MSRVLYISAVLGLFLLPVDGHAQSAKERAKSLYNAGSGHYSAGRYVEAIDAFKQAYQIKPVPVLLRTLAKVYEKLDDLPMAIDYYQRYLGTQPKDAAKIRPKVARLSATMATWPSLNLKSTPPGATIRVGSARGRVYGRTPTTLRLAPKRQIIVLEKPGYKMINRPILFEAGTHRSMTITLSSLQPAANPAAVAPAAPAAGAVTAPVVPAIPVPTVPVVKAPVAQPKATPPAVQAAPRPAPVAVPVPVVRPTVPTPAPIAANPVAPPVSVAGPGTVTAAASTGGDDLRLWAWVGIGTGAALVLGGSITGAMAVGTKGDLDDCQADPTCQRTAREGSLAGDVQSQALTTDVLIGTGALIAGGGLLLYFLQGNDGGSAAQSGVSIVPTPTGAAAIGQVRF